MSLLNSKLYFIHSEIRLHSDIKFYNICGNKAILTIYNKFNMSSELKYRVASKSSEDLQATADNLLNPKGKGGWQSGRFCNYPQEIVIQFL